MALSIRNLEWPIVGAKAYSLVTLEPKLSIFWDKLFKVLNISINVFLPSKGLDHFLFWIIIRYHCLSLEKCSCNLGPDGTGARTFNGRDRMMASPICLFVFLLFLVVSFFFSGCVLLSLCVYRTYSLLVGSHRQAAAEFRVIAQSFSTATRKRSRWSKSKLSQLIACAPFLKLWNVAMSEWGDYFEQTSCQSKFFLISRNQ